MSIESFIKKMGSKIGTGIENIAHERARRLSNPAFQAELMRSRSEFVKHLSTTGTETLGAIYHFGASLGKLVWFGARSAFEKDKTLGNAVTKSLDELGTSTGHLGRAVLNGVKLAGRGGLHTIRWLFAK